MNALHFGAGNIGRGFIGEVLYKNGYEMIFVDINEAVIDALNAEESYQITICDDESQNVTVTGFKGINNGSNPEAVVEAIASTNLVTTAIGPNILPYIAPLMAKGIELRQQKGVTEALDMVACENMIGGSTFLKEKVYGELSEEGKAYADQYIGFPDAAVDRIVPNQTNENILDVTVELYKELVISESMMKQPNVRLDGVKYVEDLEPYIERKLYTVNTGHATTAYFGFANGFDTIDHALANEEIYQKVRKTLSETGQLLIEKWQFNADEHQAYIETTLERFKNPALKDEVTRVGRTPIRKLGYNERFINPIRQASERGLAIDGLIDTVVQILKYNDPADEQAVQLQAMLKEKPVEEVIKEVTQLQEQTIIDRIVKAYVD